jgi:hypothetical protein
MNIDMTRLEEVLQRSSQAFALVGVASLLWLAIALMNRRVRHSNGHASITCHIAATIGVTFGALAVIGGLGHSMAVGSLALRETEYGSVQILRFTTGALLLYSGAMNIALYRAIRAGRTWAIGVGVATNLLFWLHLLFVLPFPGTGGTVPRPLGAWSVYLLWLGAAAVASRRDIAAPEFRS